MEKINCFSTKTKKESGTTVLHSKNVPKLRVFCFWKVVLHIRQYWLSPTFHEDFVCVVMSICMYSHVLVSFVQLQGQQNQPTNNNDNKTLQQISVLSQKHKQTKNQQICFKLSKKKTALGNFSSRWHLPARADGVALDVGEVDNLHFDPLHLHECTSASNVRPWLLP